MTVVTIGSFRAEKKPWGSASPKVGQIFCEKFSQCRFRFRMKGGHFVSDEYKVTDVNAVAVSASVMCSVLGVGDRMIRKLAEQGILKRSAYGKYMLLESIKNYIITLKLSKAADNLPTAEDDLDLNIEKAKHEHIKSQITEIKLQLISGNVHKSEDVERVISNMFAKFRSKMTAMPAKLAPKLVGAGREEIQDFLKAEISAALEELADYNPADYYSDEHIDIEDDDVVTLLREDEENADEENRC